MTILIFIGCKAQGNLQRNGRVTPCAKAAKAENSFCSFVFRFIGLVAVLQGPLEKVYCSSLSYCDRILPSTRPPNEEMEDMERHKMVERDEVLLAWIITKYIMKKGMD